MAQPFNQVMDYIEAHLTEEISGERISKLAGLSEYHFKRMFSYMAGMSLQEYVKNRRLSLANVELVDGAKVTDVAYKYGYQSIEGFSRAIREWSGFLPSEAARNKIQKSFPKFTFFIDIRGDRSMEFKIVKKEKFHIVGVSKRVPIQFEGENQAILDLAQSIAERQRHEMHQLADLVPHHVLNVSYDFDEGFLEERGQLTHMIGFATTRENPFDDLEQISIEESLWPFSRLKDRSLLCFKKRPQESIPNGCRPPTMKRRTYPGFLTRSTTAPRNRCTAKFGCRSRKKAGEPTLVHVGHPLFFRFVKPLFYDLPRDAVTVHDFAVISPPRLLLERKLNPSSFGKLRASGARFRFVVVGEGEADLPAAFRGLVRVG